MQCNIKMYTISSSSPACTWLLIVLVTSQHCMPTNCELLQTTWAWLQVSATCRCASLVPQHPFPWQTVLPLVVQPVASTACQDQGTQRSLSLQQMSISMKHACAAVD